MAGAGPGSGPSESAAGAGIMIMQEQLHCFDALTGPGSVILRQGRTHPTLTGLSRFSAASGGKMARRTNKNTILGLPQSLEVGSFFQSFIIQFAAICSALSASRPELKSGTQGYRP